MAHYTEQKENYTTAAKQQQNSLQFIVERSRLQTNNMTSQTHIRYGF